MAPRRLWLTDEHIRHKSLKNNSREANEEGNNGREEKKETG